MDTVDIDIKKRCDIIDLIDPLKLNSEYSTKSLDDLMKELDEKTRALITITHDSYQKIYDMPSSKMSKTNELTILKYKLSKKEDELNEMEHLLRVKEEELLLREINMGRRLESKSPISVGRSSASPSMYQPYNYMRTPNRFSVEEESSPIFINGDFSEQKALEEAIKKSEKEANEILDKPFKDSSETGSVDDNNVHYKDKPNDVTEEQLDELYSLLINRKFDQAKAFLGSEKLSVNSARWFRNLSYKGETLKQMLLSKPEYIHKCIKNT